MTDPLWALNAILRECELLRSTIQPIREASIVIIEDLCREQLRQRGGENGAATSHATRT